MKSNINITIDTEVLIELKKEGINVSGLTNSFLRTYSKSGSSNVKDTQLDALKDRIRELEEEKINKRNKPKVVVKYDS